MQKILYLDKLIDELAKEKSVEKILRNKSKKLCAEHIVFLFGK